MNQRTKDVIVIPSIITLVGGFLFMLWGAWYSGVKWHSPFSLYWFKQVFAVPIPLWFVTVLVGISTFIGWKGYVSWHQFKAMQDANTYLKQQWEDALPDILAFRYLKNRTAQLEERIAELRSNAPKVHVSWALPEGSWTIQEIRGEQYMFFTGRAIFSTSNTLETIALTKSYLPGTKPWGNIMLTKIPPSELVHQNFHVQLKPVIGKPSEDFIAKFIFVDTKGNEYEAPEHTFRNGR